jgi:hypothetical protein
MLRPDAFSLQLLLKKAESLIYVVIAYQDLHYKNSMHQLFDLNQYRFADQEGITSAGAAILAIYCPLAFKPCRDGSGLLSWQGLMPAAFAAEPRLASGCGK